LEKEASKLTGEVISIANSSDPYPCLEAKNKLTRNCLKILSKNDCLIQIVTKSTIVTRDIDLLTMFPCTVSLTITSDDDTLTSLIEPNAPLASERLKAIEKLVAHNIPVSVRVDPIIPLLNDKPDSLIAKLSDLGVKHITSSIYKVKLDNWKRFSEKLPYISKRIKPLYFERGETIGTYFFIQKDLRLKILKNIKGMVQKKGMSFGVCREGFQYLNTASCDGQSLFPSKR